MKLTGRAGTWISVVCGLFGIGLAASAQTTDADGIRMFDKPVTIKVSRVVAADFKFYGTDSVDSNNWTDLYKQYGIQVQNMWTVADETQNKTKMNLAIASGDYPDIIKAGASDYVNWARNGVIADISALYDKLTPHAKAYFQIDDGLGLASAKVDGKLYGLPHIDNRFDGAMVLWLRNDWLKNLGLQPPKTVADLENIAVAFTKKDPDKNGRNDTYGLALNGKEVYHYFSGMQAFFEMYGAAPGYWDSNFTFVKQDGKVVWGGATAGMKPALTQLQRMVAAGTISPEFGVMDGNKVLSEVTSGKAGMYFAPMWGCMSVQNDLLKINPKADLIAVPLPGINSGTPGKAFLRNPVVGYFTVSAKCKNPEALITLFNLSVERFIHTKDDAEYDKYWGVPGKTNGWKLSICGVLPPLKNYDNYKKESVAIAKRDPSGLNLEQRQNYEQMLKYLDVKTVEGANPDYVAGWGLYKVFADKMGGYSAVDQIITKKQYNDSAYNAPPTAVMASKFPVLDKLTREILVKIAYGSSKVDDYDAFLKNWSTLGGDEVSKEANAWYLKNAQ